MTVPPRLLRLLSSCGPGGWPSTPSPAPSVYVVTRGPTRGVHVRVAFAAPAAGCLGPRSRGGRLSFVRKVVRKGVRSICMLCSYYYGPLTVPPNSLLWSRPGAGLGPRGSGAASLLCTPGTLFREFAPCSRRSPVSRALPSPSAQAAPGFFGSLPASRGSVRPSFLSVPRCGPWGVWSREEPRGRPG